MDSGWISVEERLPAYGMGSRLVIAYRPELEGDERISTLFYDATRERWGGKYDVTHWQPIPEPPK